MVLSDTIQLVRLLQIKVGFQALHMQHVAHCRPSEAPHHKLLQRLYSRFNSYLLHLPASASQLNFGILQATPTDASIYRGREQIAIV